MSKDKLELKEQLDNDSTSALLAQVASIICAETCGLTSQCKSREAAKALFDRGYLKLPTTDYKSTV